MNIDDKIKKYELLRLIPLFEKLNDLELEKLDKHLKTEQFGEWETVVLEGDQAKKLYILIDGEVQVVKDHGLPTSTTIDVLTPISYFGEMALIDNDKRSATVITTKPSLFYTIGQECFKKLLLENSNICYHMLRETFKRLRQANDLLALYSPEDDKA